MAFLGNNMVKNDEKMIIVFTSHDQVAVSVVKSILKSAKIHFIEQCVGLRGYGQIPPGEIIVGESDAERAINLIENLDLDNF